jgi:hypothetical protein
MHEISNNIIFIAIEIKLHTYVDILEIVVDKSNIYFINVLILIHANQPKILVGLEHQTHFGENLTHPKHHFY